MGVPFPGLSFVPNIRHTTSELRKKNRDQRPIYRMGFQSFQCLNWTELNWEQCLMSSEFELELWQLLWVFKWKLPSRKESSTLRFFNQLFWGMSWQRQDGISWGGGCLTLINRNISPSIEIYLSAYLKIYLNHLYRELFRPCSVQYALVGSSSKPVQCHNHLG